MMLLNPFKFGSVVDSQYFTNRKDEVEQISAILDSDVHLILISPRRFGKTSLVSKVLTQLDRPVISIDLQVITTEVDLAEQLLKRIYKLFPYQKLKSMLKRFSILPTITLNPLSDDIAVQFESRNSEKTALEDVLGLINHLSKPERKLVVVFDEFQETQSISSGLTNKMRSVMQYHKDINYVFLGSQESMMRNIFERQVSPFYHFGSLLVLDRIPKEDFENYLGSGLSLLELVAQQVKEVVAGILEITGCHPYYTQQLAWHVWELLRRDTVNDANPVTAAVNQILMNHDHDFERLWYSQNKTDKKLLIGMATTDFQPTSSNFLRESHINSTSTAQSSLSRLTDAGMLLKTKRGYHIEDPFLSEWIYRKRTRI